MEAVERDPRIAFPSREHVDRPRQQSWGLMIFAASYYYLRNGAATE
jgi:hypothetical protein